MPKSRGFTLVELLVVIAIIGILASLGFFGFQTAQKKARDAQRKNDLKEVKQALEAYAGAHNGLFPNISSCSGNSHNTGIFKGDCAGTAPGPLCGYLPDPSKIDDSKAPGYAYLHYAIGDTGVGGARGGALVARLEGEGNDKAVLVICMNGIVEQRALPASPSLVSCVNIAYFGIVASVCPIP